MSYMWSGLIFLLVFFLLVFYVLYQQQQPWTQAWLHIEGDTFMSLYEAQLREKQRNL